MDAPYTAGHQRRVSRLATAIARETGLSTVQIKGVSFGSLIHYVGKIAVPAELLSKPTTLSPLEIEFIRGHSLGSYDPDVVDVRLRLFRKQGFRFED